MSDDDMIRRGRDAARLGKDAGPPAQPVISRNDGRPHRAGGRVNIQPFLFGDGWVEVKDGNDTCRAIFDCHYSRYFYADGRKPSLFVGPGEKMVLLMADASAICAWRKFISLDKQDGVNCAIFRREGGDPASEILLKAMELAWQRWPGERFYTYVSPYGVKPTFRAGRPTWGHCFYQAGWRFCGLTKKGLHILEATK